MYVYIYLYTWMHHEHYTWTCKSVTNTIHECVTNSFEPGSSLLSQTSHINASRTLYMNMSRTHSNLARVSCQPFGYLVMLFPVVVPPLWHRPDESVTNSTTSHEGVCTSHEGERTHKWGIHELYVCVCSMCNISHILHIHTHCNTLQWLS